MARERKILKQILGLAAAILLTNLFEVETNKLQETNMDLQFSYIDEPRHHMRQRRAVYTDFVAEIEINASDISVINKLKFYLNELIQNNFLIANVTLVDLNFTTVCNMLPGTTDYQCNCENQYFWPCDKCTEYGRCNNSITNNTCSCINAYPNNGQFCRPISEMTNVTTCQQTATSKPVTTAKTASTAKTATTVKTPATVTPAQPPTTTLTVIKMSMRINIIFETSLTIETDPKYRSYVANITSAIENSYKNLPNYIKGSVNVIGFRSGSIITDYTITANSTNLNVTDANTQVSKTLSGQGIPLSQDAFANSVETNLTTKNKYYPQQNVELKCTLPNSVTGTMKWSVNGKDLAGNSSKYTISNDNSTLIVNNASESDSGRYSCIIQSSPLPYIQWQTVSIEPRPNIIVDKTDIKLQCQNQTVPLTCCADGYSVQWFGIPAVDVVTNSGPGCITLQHKIFSTNCGPKKNFTCRLNMTELQTFDYSNRTVQVQTVSEYNCINDTLGVGKISDRVTGLCEKGLEGLITYECKQTTDLKYNWTEVQRDCVVQPIKDLERRSKVYQSN
nr:adhesion G protein-coupled receptor F5-like [Misgurnus anguillicaudatus]